MKNYKNSDNTYDDGDIPQVDLPQNLSTKDTPGKNIPNNLDEYQVPFKEFPPIHPPTVDEITDVIPDEVPRRDCPGGNSTSDY